MKKNIEELEAKFQTALAFKNEKEMYVLICACCENILKKLLTGFPKRNDFEDLVFEATTKCYKRLMNHLEKDSNYKVENLCNFCFLSTYFTLRNPKRQFEDANLSYEELTEAGWNGTYEELDRELEKEQKEERLDWIKELKEAIKKALDEGESKVRILESFDLSEVKELTILDCKKKNNFLVLRSRFENEQ